MMQISYQYTDVFEHLDLDDFHAMLAWIEHQGLTPAEGVNADEINADLVQRWKRFREQRARLSEADQVISLPTPGTFPLYATIREESKYSDQAASGMPFKVKVGADGYWHGNNNCYRTSDLQFFWFSAEAGEFFSLNLDR